MSDRRFNVGFAVILAGFALANVYTYETVRLPRGCDDCFGPFGFPLPVGEFGGFAGQTHYFVSGIVADIAIGLVASAVAGWALARAVPPVVARTARVAVVVANWHRRTRL